MERKRFLVSFHEKVGGTWEVVARVFVLDAHPLDAIDSARKHLEKKLPLSVLLFPIAQDFGSGKIVGVDEI